MDTIWCSEEQKVEIIRELEQIGCCELCILRYLGVKDPHIYRDREAILRILGRSNDDQNEQEGNPKRNKPSPCTACLGLLQVGTQEQSLNHIVKEIKESKIEGLSYCLSLSLPIATQIRAYSLWFYLSSKFPLVYESIVEFKPESISMKSVWKWVVTKYLQNVVCQNAEWSNNGKLTVQIYLLYLDEEKECTPFDKFITQDGKIQLKKGRVAVSRQSVDAAFSTMKCDKYFDNFQSPPSVPTNSVSINRVQCSHVPVYIAGRYCKFSRTLSQTPWFIDGVRKTETSVEELMSGHVMKLLGPDETRFSSSGREDVDVRSLGRGRPFVFEVINPRRAILSREKMRKLQDDINQSTNLISVRDLQVVDKRDLKVLKDGEDSKTKSYCALCVAPSTTITEEHCQILNNVKTPLVLQQKTPVRVMHRRNLAIRERSIIEMRAVPALPDSTEHNNLFVLYLKTQAGTYVKEFVHGDLGRTSPNVSDLLGFGADIIALDVEGVDLDWPPEIKNGDTKEFVDDNIVASI